MSDTAEGQAGGLDKPQHEKEQPESKDNEKNVKDKRIITGIPFVIITAVAVAGIVYQLWNAGFGRQADIQLRSVHWAYMAFIGFLVYPAWRKSPHHRPSVLDWVFAIGMLVVGFYVFFTWQEVAARLGFTIPRDVVFGVIAVLLLLELVRRAVGIPLLIVVLAFLAFAFLGPWMPGAFIHRGVTLDGLIRVLYIGTDGIYGIPIGISASFVILFIIFGSFLQESGGGKLFTDIAFGLVGKTTGGPAKSAVMGSIFIGMVSGTAIANVVTTGIITIPLMKKNGYKGHTAGAIESVASTAGMITPPVLGASAFMMAEFVGIPYRTVALATLPIALLFFLFLFVSVHLEAKKYGLKGLDPSLLPSVMQSLKERGHLILPLLILIGLIVSGRSPSNSVFWGIVSIIVISALRKNTRMGPKQIVNAIRSGVIAGLPVAIACAGAGIITGVIGLTGLGLRFSSILIDFSGGYLFLMLIMAMITAIILGLGMPMSATYAILAVLTAPAIIRLGVEPLAAHYFLFFFGAMSTITPPVGLSAIAAAGIARADPMRTSFEAVRMGLVGFILPFMAIYNQGLLLLDTPLNALISIGFCAIAVVGLTFATQGMTYRRLTIPERLMFLAPVIVIFFPTPLPVNLAAVAVGVLVLLWTRRGRQTEAVAG